MRPWVLLPVAVLVGAPAGVLAGAAAGGPTGAEADDASSRAASLSGLARDLELLARRQASESARLDAIESGAAHVTDSGTGAPSDDEIAAAVQRWREANGAIQAGNAAGEAPAAAPGGIAELDMEAVVQLFLAGGSRLEVEALFQELREAGRIDEFVEWIERMAAENPEDANLQVARGVSYLQKLFSLGRTPDAGIWAMKADQAFDTALEIDPRNWDARFTKAVALSNWPAFLGRTGEAISQFENLLEQQKALPPNPQHAQTYLFLGNMYVQTGEKEKALATWREGLARFPDHEGLRRQLEVGAR